jgi:cytochrome c-type biogenesis protein CcmH/NrfF
MSDITDPVLIKRAQVARAVKIGKRAGYGCILVACVAFGFIWLDKPTDTANTVIAWSMGVGSLFLAPAIVFGYAVAKAEREEKADMAALEARRAAKRNSAPPAP